MPVWFSVPVRACACVMLGVCAVIWLGGLGELPSLADVPYLEPVLVWAAANAALLLIGVQSSDERLQRDISGRFITQPMMLILLAFAAVNTVIGFQALSATNAAVYWAAAFFVPALVNGLVAVRLLTLREPETGKDPPAEEGEAEEAVRTAVERSAVTAKEAFRTSLLRGFLLGVIFALLAGLVPICIRSHQVLQDAIFREEFAGWYQALTAWPENLAVFLVLGASYFVLGFVIYLALGTADSAIRRQRERKHKDLYRELTEEETALIRTSIADLDSFLAAQVRPRGLTTVNWALGIGFAGLLLAYLIFLYDPGSGIGAPWFERLRTEGEPWHLYLDGAGAGDILALLACALFYLWVSLKITGRLKASAGGYVAEPTDTGLAAFREEIAHQVRMRKLRPGDVFDPAFQFSATDAAAGRGALGLAIISTLLALCFLYLDRMDYTLFTERGITYTNYWTAGRFQADYDEVTEVSLKCYPDSDDDVTLVYAVHLGSTRILDGLNAGTPRQLRSLARHKLDGWEQLDKTLRAKGVPFRYGLRRVSSRREKAFLAGFCKAGLHETLEDRPLAQRIWALLQLSPAKP